MTASFILANLKTLTFIFHIIQPTELSTVNIARDTTAILCDALVSPDLFDGNLQRVVIMTTCPGGQKLEIYLNGEHHVHYVMVFEGTGPNPNIGQLNYFAVKVSVLEDVDCGSYPGVSTGSIENKGLRVNCNPSRSFFQYVSIFLSQNIGLKIAEVEVHTFSSGVAGDRPLLYRGCFGEFQGFSSIMRRGLGGCQADCLRIDKLFMAIKENSKCHCHDNYIARTKQNEARCNLTCSDGRYVCGGINSFSVYLISVRLPYYVGCFATPQTFALENTIDNTDMSIEQCLYACEIYHYALLKNGSICGCRNEVDSIMGNPLTHECGLHCKGNRNQTCGGSDVMSVYKTCYKESSDTSKCSTIFKCKRMIYPVFSSCGGDCVDSFIGDHCLSRRFPPIVTHATVHPRPPQPTQMNRCKITDPCINITLTECVIFRGRTLCHCIIGFTRKSQNVGCEDMDECEFNPCDVEYSVCHNKNGSYDCICKDKYVQLTEDICIVNSSDDGLDNYEEYEPAWKRIFKGKIIISFMIVAMIGIGFFICRKAPSQSLSGEHDIETKSAK